MPDAALDALVVALVALPALAALSLAWPPARRRALALVGGAAALVAGITAVALVGRVLDGPVTVGPAPAVLRFDELGALLAAVVSLLAVTVLTYARRNLAEDPAAWRFALAAAALLTGTLVVATAGRLSVLAAGWVLSSLAVVGLIGYRGDPTTRAAAARAARALGAGDGALVLAVVAVLATVGDLDLAALDAAVVASTRTEVVLGPLSLPADGVLLAGLAAAAAARAAQVPVVGWLTGTVAAPTPVSALLHAGAVNAGGFVLVRMGPTVEAAPGVAAALAMVTLVTIPLAAGMALVRPDVKGALAASTSAQMGFMLLAVTVGAPAAALTHLVGHAFYKATRFLGAGDALERAARDRRHPAVAAPSAPPARLALALVLPAGALVGLWVVLGLTDLPSGEAWLIGAAAFAAGAQATWSLLSRSGRSTPRAVGAALGALVLVGGLYLAVVTGLGALLDPVLTHSAPPVDARLALGVLAALVAGGAVASRRPGLSAPTVAFLAGLGRSAPAAR